MKSKLIYLMSTTLAVAFLLAFGFQSCQKLENASNSNSDDNLSSDLTGAVAEVASSTVVENSNADVHSASLEKYDGLSAALYLGGSAPWGIPGMGMGKGKFGIPHIDKCATVTVSSVAFPREIVITYDSTCAKGKHHIKTGKIIINISDTITAEGSVISIVYQDFYIDSIKVDFSATFKNLGKNDEGNWVVESSSDITITKNGESNSVSKSETIEWVSGFETTGKSDDIFYRSGSGTISVGDSITFSRTITTPLLIDRSCEYILSGTVELMRKGVTTTIDYGDGTCDDIATVTINGVTEEISLASHSFNEGGKFGNSCRGFGKKGNHNGHND